MTPTNEMPLNVWCELRSSHPTERFVCIYTEPAKGRTKYLRATPDKVMVDRAELERVNLLLNRIVPFGDFDRELMREVRQILEAAMKVER